MAAPAEPDGQAPAAPAPSALGHAAGTATPGVGAAPARALHRRVGPAAQIVYDAGPTWIFAVLWTSRLIEALAR